MRRILFIFTLVVLIGSNAPCQELAGDLYSARKDSCFEAAQIALALTGRFTEQKKLNIGWVEEDRHVNLLRSFTKARLRFEYETLVDPKRVVSKLEAGFSGVVIETEEPRKGGERAYYLISYRQGQYFYHRYPRLNKLIVLPAMMELLVSSKIYSLTYFAAENISAEIAEAPVKMVYPNLSELIETTANKASGSGLLKGVNIELPASVDMGKLARTAKSVVASFTLHNTGIKDVEILSVQGSCSCFQRHEGPRLLKAGSSARMSLYFSPDKFRLAEEFKTSVAFELSDESLKSAVVKVMGRFTDENYCYLAFDPIDYGTVSRASFQGKALRCSLYMLRHAPSGFKVTRYSTQSEKTVIEEIGIDSKVSAGALVPVASYLVKPDLAALSSGSHQIDFVVETNDPVYKQVSASAKFILLD
jgi:hypothetical protein